MRTIIDYSPFEDRNKFWGDRGRWPAKWVTHAAADGSGPIVQALRRTFTLGVGKTVRVHVSADQRYELFLDGQRIGRGPERGDRANWPFETYDLPLAAGPHTLVARTWWLGDLAPFAQVSVRPAFVLAAEGDGGPLLNTGVAAWDAKVLGGYQHIPAGPGQATGPKVHIVGRDFDWDYARGGGDGWTAAHALDWAVGPDLFGDQPPVPILVPATLPPMLERVVHVGRARHVHAPAKMPPGEVPVRAADHLADEAVAWDALLAGRSPLTVPPRTARRVIVDLGDYFSAYTDLVTTGGAGAIVRTAWAESLYLPDEPGQPRSKGNRDQIEGKVFHNAAANVFETDGGDSRTFGTLWWEPGRYVELIVTTADAPLTIDGFSLRETHYPHDCASRFETDDARFADLTPITRRVMEMCSHETYMDCPYYEQLQYIGDTRLEVLTTYACTPDDRLPRKALRLFDQSRAPNGFTQSRYPARVPQYIPPFSAWWVAMVHDYAMWRDDAAFVRGLLPGVRNVLDAFVQATTADGLIAGPGGWNFYDWVQGWNAGIPPGGNSGEVSGPLNFHLVWTLKQAADLEEHFGEPELAALNRRRATTLAAAAAGAFWDENRGLYADDAKRTHFSEHAQCLALLADAVDTGRRPQVVDHLFTDDRLARTTIYFSHYLFEACAATGRIAPMFERLKLWFDLKGEGFKTTLESPEPSRSDCHAWGAHPMYHYYATLLGIRPAAPGFRRVTVRPQLGPLQWARGSMTHPRGRIEVDVRQTDGRLSGTVTLPPGVEGTLVANGRTQAIGPAGMTF